MAAGQICTRLPGVVLRTILQQFRPVPASVSGIPASVSGVFAAVPAGPRIVSRVRLTVMPPDSSLSRLSSLRHPCSRRGGVLYSFSDCPAEDSAEKE
jgi:hypothetical protein